MFICAIVGLATGDARRMIFATDYLGNTCGSCKNDSSCGTSIYYPRPWLDALMQGFDPSDPASIVSGLHLYGVCVDSCPQVDQYVCNYDVQKELEAKFLTVTEIRNTLDSCTLERNRNSLGIMNNYGATMLSEPCSRYMANCWKVIQKQTDIFFRCVGEPVLNVTSEYFCYYPAYQGESQQVRMPATICPDQLNSPLLDEACDDATCYARSGKPCRPNDRCLYVLEEETTFQVQSNQADGLTFVLGEISGWTSSISRSFSDVEKTWWTILIVGLLGSVILGFLWLFLLEYTVLVFIWLMVVLSLLGLVLCVLICFAKAGNLEGTLKVISAATNDTSIQTTLGAAGSTTQGLWTALGVILSILTVIYFLIIIVMRRKIKLAALILEEASKALLKMKAMIFVPIYSCICTLVLFIYGLTIFGYLYTSGYTESSTLSIEGLAAGVKANVEQLAQDVQNSRRLANDTNWLADVAKGTGTALTTVVSTTGITGMLIYHIFGCLWTLQVISGINVLTIAEAVSRWYWTRDKDNMSHVVVLASFKRVLFSHYGTACFGGFLITIVQMFRIIVYYISKQTEKLQKDNSMIKIVVMMLQCCLWCFEKILKYITQNAYIMVAMYGCSYCQGAKLAVEYMLKNIGRVGVVNFVNRLISWLSILVIVTACTILEYIWLEQDKRFQYGGDCHINSSTLSVVMTGLGALWISNAFMQIYSIAVDTILLCFCVDAAKNKESKNYYMSGSLRKFFSRKRAKNKKKKGPNNSTQVVPT